MRRIRPTSSRSRLELPSLVRVVIVLLCILVLQYKAAYAQETVTFSSDEFSSAEPEARRFIRRQPRKRQDTTKSVKHRDDLKKQQQQQTKTTTAQEERKLQGRYGGFLSHQFPIQTYVYGRDGSDMTLRDQINIDSRDYRVSSNTRRYRDGIYYRSGKGGGKGGYGSSKSRSRGYGYVPDEAFNIFRYCVPDLRYGSSSSSSDSSSDSQDSGTRRQLRGGKNRRSSKSRSKGYGYVPDEARYYEDTYVYNPSGLLESNCPPGYVHINTFGRPERLGLRDTTMAPSSNTAATTPAPSVAQTAMDATQNPTVAQSTGTPTTVTAAPTTATAAPTATTAAPTTTTATPSAQTTTATPTAAVTTATPSAQTTTTDPTVAAQSIIPSLGETLIETNTPTVATTTATPTTVAQTTDPTIATTTTVTNALT